MGRIMFSFLPILTALIALILILGGFKFASELAPGNQRFDFITIATGFGFATVTIIVGTILIYIVSFFVGGTTYTTKHSKPILTFSVSKKTYALADKKPGKLSKKFYYYTNDNGYSERHTANTGDKRVIIKYDNPNPKKPYVELTSGCERESAAKYFIPCIRPCNRVLIFHLSNEKQIKHDFEPPETIRK